MMKRILLLTAFIFALAAAQSSAQVSTTDRLAVDSGVSLWLNAWKAAKTDPSKLQPLYRKDVVTHSTVAGQVKRSWTEFANLIRDGSAELAAVIAGQNDDPQITVAQDRIVTSFSSGIRLVWEKTNGVWRIVEQNLPAAPIAKAIAAD
jgi:hypothetical protein